MKRTILLFFIILVTSLLHSTGISQVSTSNGFIDEFPETSLASVEIGLAAFIGKIPDEMISDYGFDNHDELQQAKLGTPYRLYTIQPSSILDNQKRTSIAQILVKTQLWYFPVLVDQSYRAMLLVEESKDGSYTPVSFGYIPLAAELNRVASNETWSLTSEVKLVVVYQAREFFLAQPVSEPQKLFPLQYDEKANLTPNDDLFYHLERIRPVVELNMKGGF